MARPLPKSAVRIAASITLAILAILSASELIHWIGDMHPDRQVDFRVYLTAAQLVRQNAGVKLYDQADTGENPQIRLAPPHSLFQHTASSLGIPSVRLYVYPPTLADLLVPFTFLSLRHAINSWLVFNLLCLLLTAILLTWLLCGRIAPLAALGLFAAMFCLRGNIFALEQGQISIVLLLLWTAGIVFYGKQSVGVSAAAMALAAAIKLTPLLVVLPFFFWKEWKWLRWFSASILAISLALCVINGPHALLDYVLHVMPPMSTGFSHIDNLSLSSGLTQLYLGLTGGDFRTPDLPIPHLAAEAIKAIVLCVFAAALFLVYRIGPLRSTLQQAQVLSLLALLSLCCSPISWRSAFGLASLAAVFLWKQALDRSTSAPALLLLVVCTLEFSFFLDTIVERLTHGILLSTTALLAPATGCVLIFCTLLQIQRSQQTTNRPHKPDGPSLSFNLICNGALVPPR